jgi:hypothetical protein
MPLRKADTTVTRRFEDGEDWIELRVRLTKGQRDQLADIQQNYRVDGRALTGDPEADRSVEMRGRIAEFNRAAFGFLCTGWSLSETPDIAQYVALDEESGAWVDKCISEVLIERASAEGNDESSSTTPSGSRGTRAKAAR